MLGRRGSGISLVFILLILAVVIALCSILLVPHLGYRLLFERGSRRRRLTTAASLSGEEGRRAPHSPRAREGLPG